MSDQGVPAERPPAPFIVGAARSGTTLLRMMLDAHSELAIAPETHFIPQLARVWCESEAPARAVTQTIITHERWADFRLDSREFETCLTQPPVRTLADALRILYGMYAAKFGKTRWGDKTPPYVMHLPLIAGLLPEARFIHMIRDGRDVALSLLRLWFGKSSIEEAAQWWVDRVTTARNSATLVASYTEVRYETLLNNPESELRRLCDFLQLGFEPTMLTYNTRVVERFAELSRADSGPPLRTLQASAAMARMELMQMASPKLQGPPDPAHVARWRTDMKPEEQHRFVAIAGETLTALGYPLE